MSTDKQNFHTRDQYCKTFFAITNVSIQYGSIKRPFLRNNSFNLCAVQIHPVQEITQRQNLAVIWGRQIKVAASSTAFIQSSNPSHNIYTCLIANSSLN